MRKFWYIGCFVLGFSLAPLAAFGDNLFSFSAGSAISATKLNANFTRLYTLVNAVTTSQITDDTIRDGDIYSAAAISHSKLATPNLLPKFVAYVQVAASEATFVWKYGVAVDTNITDTGTGAYTITWTTPRTDATYGVIVSLSDEEAVAVDSFCYVDTKATTSFVVRCSTDASNAVDADFTVVMYDDA